MAFRNGNVVYTVAGVVIFQRTYGDGHTTEYGESGGVTVDSNGRQIADIACKDDTVKFDFNALGIEPRRDYDE